MDRFLLQNKTKQILRFNCYFWGLEGAGRVDCFYGPGRELEFVASHHLNSSSHTVNQLESGVLPKAGSHL